MEGAAVSGEYDGLLIWGVIALAWAGLTFVTLKRLRFAQGRMRALWFLPGVVTVAVLVAPAWFFAVLVLGTLGSTNPEGPVGAGGPALIAALIFGVLTGILVSAVVTARRPKERGLS